MNNLQEFLLSGNSGKEKSKKSGVNSAEGQGEPIDQVKQAQAKLAKIVVDAQTTAHLAWSGGR